SVCTYKEEWRRMALSVIKITLRGGERCVFQKLFERLCLPGVRRQTPGNGAAAQPRRVPDTMSQPARPEVLPQMIEARGRRHGDHRVFIAAYEIARAACTFRTQGLARRSHQ